jgi:hypothetical protein
VTVDDLREKLEGIDGSLEIVVKGHFGEGLRVNSWDWRVNSLSVGDSYWDWREICDSEPEDAFVIPYTSIGDAPD